MDKLKAALEGLFPGHVAEVAHTEDELLPPYCIKLFKGGKEVAHTHVSEPNAEYAAHKLFS